ncbi:hypothetical protein HY041_01005, partial [Candidatus Roizmanbacteria bacterium]|nr:hypothetical protein [Candidatus Roizmanbacteria bacterium]
LDKDVVTKFPKNFDWRKKRPSIKAIWGGEKGRSLNQIALMRQQQLFKNTLMPFADNTDSDYELHHIAFTPFSDRLANRAVQKTAQYYGEDLKKRAGYQWELVPLPQGGCIFFWWKSEGVNSEKKRELIDHELKKYLAMQKKDIFFSDLRADEMNTILDHFVPPVNNSLIATEIPILLEEVQGGLNPISVRGYLNHLRLPEEQFLRDMGFRSIKYNQVDEGVLIDVRWKWWHFRFILDRGYEAKGLKEISEAKSNWLLRTVLLYLKRIKNPPDDSGQSLIVTESLFDEENDDFPVVTEDDEEGRRFHGKRPHLKVLPFGHLPQSLDSSDIMDQMELHYKRSLRFFNGLFFQLQNNPELLDSPPEGAIKDFFETPDGKTIRAHLKKLLQNTFKKDSHPVWQKRDFVHNVPYWLLPESVGAEFNPRDPRQMFWLAFVHEAIVQGALPLNISCPGVGEEIAQVHLAGLT